MPESRLERTRAAYRPELRRFDPPRGGLAFHPDAFVMAWPRAEVFDLAGPAPRVDVLTGKGRYFPNEEQRQRAALARLAGGDPYGVRILNP